MCFILFAYEIHPVYRLLVAGNRDEYYSRPAKVLAFWPDHPNILGGRDLKGNGTWLGVNRNGRLAALTNFRDPAAYSSIATTRGALVSDFLSRSISPRVYLQEIQNRRSNYNGFNLVAGTLDGFWYYSNRENQLKKLKPGLYGISNHLLDTPWPKVVKGKELMNQLLATKNEIDSESIFKILKDQTQPEDHELPDTGIGLEWERLLSSIFIKSDTYGTRCSSIVKMNKEGCVSFEERSFDTQDLIEENRNTISYTFKIYAE